MMNRLLTDEETASIIYRCNGTVKDARREVSEAQDTKSIKLRDQEWIEEIDGLEGSVNKADISEPEKVKFSACLKLLKFRMEKR